VGKQKLIFIVDDDPFILKLVRSRLEAKDHSVKTFLYGEECLEQLHLAPDLIILDFLFHHDERENVLDGKGILEKIQASSKDVPVIMLSGQEDGDVVLELARMGIKDYVIKDHDFIDNLLAVINDLLENQV
jgi:DNA-binding NtrC family response regulator